MRRAKVEPTLMLGPLCLSDTGQCQATSLSIGALALSSECSPNPAVLLESSSCIHYLFSVFPILRLVLPRKVILCGHSLSNHRL